MNPMEEGLHALREVYDPQPEYPRPARIGKHDGAIVRAVVCALVLAPLVILGGFVWICVYA